MLSKYVSRGIPILFLDELVRLKLRRPLGVLYKDLDEALRNVKTRPVITVGDRVTSDVCSRLKQVDIQVVDLRERRVKRGPPACNARKVVRVVNPPGMLTPYSLQLVNEVLGSRCSVRVVVEGEEDLLALAIISLATKGVLLYGQPGEGVVLVDLADPKTKKVVNELIEAVI